MKDISALIPPLTSCIFPYNPNSLHNTHTALSSFQETICFIALSDSALPCLLIGIVVYIYN